MRKLLAWYLVIGCVAAMAQYADSAPEPEIRLVQVAPNVSLEVVDWGGGGHPIVLLAGGGDDVHVFEHLASRLIPENHVFGITRRGFGASSKPETGYTSRALADDILRVMDELGLEKPVLIGHSFAGEEMTSIAARFPDRLAGLVYLDAAWDRTYAPPPDKDRSADFDKVGISEAPKPQPGKFDPQVALGAGVEKPDYAKIRVPALALYAAPRTWKELMPNAPEFTDPEKREAAQRVVGHYAQTRKHMEDIFRSGVLESTVIEIPGASHYLFQTSEPAVLREIRSFLLTLEW